MKFGFYSVEGLSLYAWTRLQAEGHQVAVFIPSKDGKRIKTGDGLVKKVNSVRALCEFVGKDGTIIFDDSKAPRIADQLRKDGYVVFCGGSFCYKLESDRSFGVEVAKAAGIPIPPYKEFSSIAQGIDYVKAHPNKRFYFKSDAFKGSDVTRCAKTTIGMVLYMKWLRERFGDRFEFILQEKIEGAHLSTAWYWDGEDMIGPIEGTIENKKAFNDDLGPSTGCQMNVVWFYDDLPKIAEELHLDNVRRLFLKFQAPPGMYDINAIIAKEDRKPYFLEWTPRFGYDSEPTAQLLIKTQLADLFYGIPRRRLPELPVMTMREAYAYAIRLAIPPYPWEFAQERKSVGAVDAPIPLRPDAPLYRSFVGYDLYKKGNHLAIASDSGLVGLAATVGKNLADMHRYCLAIAKKLDIPGLFYRTDGDRAIAKNATMVRRLGYEIPGGIA